MADSKRTGIFKAQARAKVTNGHCLLPDVDHRQIWVRRFRDVYALHLNDINGEQASEAEKALVRRSACIIVELEQMEQKFALNGGGEGWELDRYQRLTNTLRRTLEATGLQRRARDITSESSQVEELLSYFQPDEPAQATP